MRSRRLGIAVAVTCLAGSIVVAGATPAAANTCATATPMGSGTEMGTVTVNGAVGVFTPDVWWEHATTAPNRFVTLQAPTGGRVTLTVYATDCATVLCGPLDSPAACTPASALPAGTLKIKVTHSPLGGQAATNYSLTASGSTATQCSDNVDNDGDGQIDYGQDPHCTSWQDNTEAPLRVAVWGHIAIYIDSAGQIAHSLTGLYADPSQFSCSLSTTGTIEVTCTEQFNPEIEYECTRFVVTATAPSPHRRATGTVAGYVRCASGAELRTPPVVGIGSTQADNTMTGMDLGRASTIVCRAEGATPGSRPSGSWQVDCTEPGVAWPFSSPRPI